ncbi:hypothetical protein PAPYR_2596 [Paratrimastix pyriformis]|uniref:Uncharacterized protein n=1 Tax=Paratrimastix pyriformis TaxID=342808 RepID=A0ABQ8URQ1_9EUKA|nr:hypothetical protein PAPYR_2596 [Paratrimastix pyriformis]
MGLTEPDSPEKLHTLTLSIPTSVAKLPPVVPPTPHYYKVHRTACCMACFRVEDRQLKNGRQDRFTRLFFGTATNSQLASHWFSYQTVQAIRTFEILLMVVSIIVETIYAVLSTEYFTYLSYYLLLAYLIVQLTAHANDSQNPPFLTARELQSMPRAPPFCCSKGSSAFHRCNVPTTTRFKWTYIMAELAFTNAFVASIIYWVLLFPSHLDRPGYEYFTTSCFHGANSLIVLTELWLLTSFLFDLAHIWVLLVEGVLYLLLMWAVYAAQGRWIYGILDWNKSGAWIWYIIIVVAFILVFSLVVLMANLRNSVARCLGSRLYRHPHVVTHSLAEPAEGEGEGPPAVELQTVPESPIVRDALSHTPTTVLQMGLPPEECPQGPRQPGETQSRPPSRQSEVAESVSSLSY